jgi:beta-glucosidase
MQIAKRDLASFDEAGSQWLAEAGTYTFRVGASSRDIRTTASVKMGAYAEKVHNVMAPKERLRLLKQ